jgi:gluconolactonase
LCFSPDERHLYVNDTDRGHIWFFDVQLDGALDDGRVWAELSGEGIGVADGMKSDGEGNLYCAGPGGIHLFDAGANCLGVIRMPEYTTNLAWGDDRGHSLYITASTSLYRLKTRMQGVLAY